MGSEVDSQLLDHRRGELQGVVQTHILLKIEQVLQVAKPETDSLGDSLRSVPRVEHSVLSSLGQQVDDSVRQVLHLVNHDVMDIGPGVAPEPDEVQDVVDRVDHVVSPGTHFPSLVLAEGLIYVKFLLLAQERVGGLLNVHFLGQVEARVQVGTSASLDGRVDLSPHQVRVNIPGRVVLVPDGGPEVCGEVVVVYLE